MAGPLSKNLQGCTLTVCQGDLTRQTVDAIVNAANSSLMGGGGVDGAIHKAGGPAILEECLQIRKTQGGCAAGEAVITSGGRLAAQYVIHTVGPIWRGGGNNEAKILTNAYRNSLQLAVDYGLKTVAFPSISTGAYGYPVEEAAKVALSAVLDFLRRRSENPPQNSESNLSEVRFVLFDPHTLNTYKSELESL
ncbi:MAG: O-acetyl-ADP-ribose deacetylase [Cyanobacteria bacterium REEB67]|nr:O-acetyl-ADP-ribose deacetylase [Cyanobacteria bacterium REEB67]